MKKLLCILAFISLYSCSSDDEPCTCIGEYTLINGVDQMGNTFSANDVDCETGERPESPLPDNALFLGCQG
ncbi:hypothetical protein GCM10011344_32700 [Dokdonia pacifica]|uniref:Lipoprotein n=1 Tax=Dokdonia pacifica TaxID=1627892 RepID=A0A239BJK2_9FLAO|nr:hypothetical protein [Dokdonia pacifica]GGG29314.1 hypothetical protein GCM10011344_32700 [Dokdonia pacifica]SNS07561.1 hypothetical protein SAMN06265376_106193 [Dokdonia pacifica]